VPAATLFALNATPDTVKPDGAVGELEPQPIAASDAETRANTKISDGRGVMDIHGRYAQRPLLVCSIVSNQRESLARAE
jgi:hypothetical protein